jgi:ribosomal protein L10
MDMKREELAVYLATLKSVIEIMNTMPNATIKKVRGMLEDEIKHMRNQIKKEDN